jgi:outer membrane protein TolC
MAMRFGPERRNTIPRADLSGHHGFTESRERSRRRSPSRLLWLAFAPICFPPILLADIQMPSAPQSNAPRLELLDAVRLTLEKDPAVQIQKKQLLIAQGAVESASGQFDPTFNAAISSGITRTPLSASQQVQNDLPAGFQVLQQESTTYQMGLNKEFRSGVSVGSSVAITRLADNANQQTPVNVSQVVFDINVPLLRGLGRTVAGAPERVAHLNADAAALDLRQTTAARVFNTVSAYWNCWAAERQVEVLRDSTNRSRRLLDDLTALVRASEFPSADLAQANADHEEKEADLLANEQQFSDARQALGLAMGLEKGELLHTPLPAPEFLEPPASLPTLGFVTDTWLQQTLLRRSDYQSALKAEQASAVLLVVARNGTKPQLDLNLQAGYTGLDAGPQFQRFPGALDPWSTPGPNLLGTLRLDLPIGRHAALGLLAQRDAARDQASIRSRDLARNIASSLENSLTELESVARELRRLDVAVQGCRQAVTNEMAKLKLGHSTVVDQITVADRCSNTLVKQIQARARYATAVVRLRYESGLLVPADRPLPASISSADLLTPLTFDGWPPPASH